MAIIPSKLAGLLARLRERGEVRVAGDEWRTRCPAHDDNGPSICGRTQDLLVGEFARHAQWQRRLWLAASDLNGCGFTVANEDHSAEPAIAEGTGKIPPPKT